MEKYLESVFMRLFVGSKDDFEQAFDYWLSNLDVEELIYYADKYMSDYKKGLIKQ